MQHVLLLMVLCKLSCFSHLLYLAELLSVIDFFSRHLTNHTILFATDYQCYIIF